MAPDIPQKPRQPQVGRRGEVLVAIMNNLLDFAVARDQHWYRIPVRSVEKFLKGRWPPRWLAFYQTKAFGGQRWAVNYYASVERVRVLSRRALFPGEPSHPRADALYHKLEIGPLQRLRPPVASPRWRRIVFIPTTWRKLMNAVEVNDLFDDSPLEDSLWAELKRLDIPAQRQFFVEANERRYALDFAVFCDRGSLDVEADGDTWHADPARIPLDNQRDNDLTTSGWSILRFNGHQIREATTEYCVPTILESINRLGGLETKGIMPRIFDPHRPDGPRQLTLFESGPEYDADSW